jgi:hypothetical protein
MSLVDIRPTIAITKAHMKVGNRSDDEYSNGVS